MYVVDPIKCYLIGGAVIAIGVGTHFKKKKRLASWITATGTVQNVRRDSHGDAKVSVRFSDQSGQLRTVSLDVADVDTVGLGSELGISFNPNNPDEAFIRDAKDMKLSLYIPLIAGLLLFGLGIFSQITLTKAGYY